MEKRLYKNPPVKEVSCDIRLDALAWDVTIPGLMYENLKAQFPLKEQRNNIENEILTDLDGFQHRIRLTESLLLKTESENVWVNIDHSRLKIIHFSPYSSWEDFQKLIDVVYQAYLKLDTNGKIRRISLRYKNVIDIQEKSFELKDYFNFYPYLGENLPQDVTAFIAGVQLPFDEGKNTLKLQLTNNNKGEIVLDLDYFSTKQELIEQNDLYKWLDQAHQTISDVFENVITDKLRVLFEEDK